MKACVLLLIEGRNSTKSISCCEEGTGKPCGAPTKSRSCLIGRIRNTILEEMVAETEGPVPEGGKGGHRACIGNEPAIPREGAAAS